jgi:Uma2 family endonuclease
VATVGLQPCVSSLDDWDRRWAHDDRYHELAKGALVLTPSERIPNLRAARKLAELLSRALPDDSVEVLPQIDVLIHGDPAPTVRRPDLAIVRLAADDDRYRVDPSEVLAAVEVLSDSTAAVDQETKRIEYASVGIPVYVIVDVRAPSDAQITVHTDPQRADYRSIVVGMEAVVPVGAGVRIHVDDLTRQR